MRSGRLLVPLREFRNMEDHTRSSSSEMKRTLRIDFLF